MIARLAFRAMNMDLLLACEDSPQAESTLRSARTFVEDCERRFSRFRPESEVSRLNSTSDKWQSVSTDLMQLLQLAKAFYTETAGLFDPTILPDLLRAGYDRSMDELKDCGELRERAGAAKEACRFDDVLLDSESLRVWLPRACSLDLTGIVKAWIVDRTAAIISSQCAIGAVSAGGDMAFKGTPREGWGWPVKVEHPLDPSRAITSLMVRGGAVATSSVVKRSWMQSGRRRHHIIDPRTGEPAVTDWLSVTAIADDILVADIYAKALLVGGRADLTEIRGRRPEVAYLMVNTDGKLETTLETEPANDPIVA